MMNLGASGLLLLWFLSGCSGQGPHPSPCPDLFSYHYDSTSGWYGIVTILPPGTFAEARLVFKMTIANYNLNQGYGRIEVLGGNAEVQEISKSAYQGQRRKVQFMIIFPPITTIPRVKEVLINDVTFCADQRYYGAGANIELKYTITTGVESPPVSGNQFSIIHSRNQPAQHSGSIENFWSKDKAHPTATVPQGSYESLRPQSPNIAGDSWSYDSFTTNIKHFVHHKTVVQQDRPILNGNGYSNVDDTRWFSTTTPAVTSKNMQHLQIGKFVTNKNIEDSTTTQAVTKTYYPDRSVGNTDNNGHHFVNPSDTKRDQLEDASPGTGSPKKKVVIRFETNDEDVVKHASFQVGSSNGTSRNFTIHFEESS